jgi:hypothetical protein
VLDPVFKEVVLPTKVELEFRAVWTVFPELEDILEE